MVDFGGLNYSIVVEDKFSGTTAAFRTEIEASRAAWAAYKAELAASAGALANLRKDTAAVAAAVRSQVRDADAAARASRRAADATAGLSDGERKLARDIRSANASLEARSLAAERNIPIYRRLAAGATLQQQAEERLAKAIERRQRDQLAAQLAEQSGANVLRSLTDRERGEARLAAILAKRRIAEETANAAARDGVTLSADRSKVFSAEAIALERIRKAEERRAITAALAEKGFDPKGETLRTLTAQEAAAKRVTDRIRTLQAELEFRRAAAGNLELRRLNEELALTENRANRISFTFRRLFGILAAFAAARLALRGIRETIAESITFNAAIEQTNLGVAALFTAVGDVRDVFGQATTAARQLELAQRGASDQVRKLRLDALQTAATFQQIADTFQVAVAPGVAAGFDIDEIRRFTIQISQAASALGVQQNQLAEEIRSILAGTIQLRTTRIAAALGITNEDIRRAKELGVLADFLNDRFQAFTVAGKESLQTFNALATNTKDAFSLLIGEAAVGFFEEVKGLLRDIQGSITQISDTGIIIDPAAKAVVEALFEGLRGAVAEARNLRSEVSFTDLAGAASAVGSGIQAAAAAVATIVTGFIRGINTLRAIITTISSDLDSIRGRFSELLPTANLREAGAASVQIATALAGVALALKTIAVLASTVFLPFRAISGILKVIKLDTLASIANVSKWITKVRALSGPYVLIGVALFSILSLLGDIFESTTGISIKFETLAKIISVTLSSAFKAAAAIAKLTFAGLFSFIRTGFNTVVIAIQGSILGVSSLVLRALEKLGAPVEDARKAIEALATEKVGNFLDQSVKDAEQLKRLAKEVAFELAEAGQSFSDGVTSALDENASAKDLSGFLADLRDKASKGLNGIFDTDLGIDGVEKQLEPLVDQFNMLPGIIGQSADRLGDTANTIKEIKDSVIDLNAQFANSLKFSNLTGAAAAAQKLILDSQVGSRSKLLEVDIKIREAQIAVNDAKARELAITRELSKASEDQFNAVLFGESALRELGTTQRELAKAKNDEVIAQLAFDKARKANDREQIASNEILLQQARQKIESLQQLEQAQSAQVNQITVGFDPEQVKKINEQILGLVSAGGQQVSAEKDLQELLKKRLEVEAALKSELELRIGLAASQEIPALQRANQELAAKLEYDRAIAAIEDRERTGIVFPLEKELEVKRAQLVLEETQLMLKQRQRDIDIAALELQIKQTENAEVRNSLQMQYNELKRAGSLEDANSVLSIQQTKGEIGSIVDKLNSPVSAGFLDGLRNSVMQYGDTLKTVSSLTETAFLGLADTISASISDALNPASQTTAKERLIAFFKSLVDEIIKQLVRLAIAKLILNIGTSAAAPGADLGAGAGAAVGQAKGGKTPRRGAASLAHFAPSVQALSGGGRVRGSGAVAHRPRGLDPRDRVPVWMRPDEWGIVPEAGRLYGDQFLAAVNARLIDPIAVKALMAGVGHVPVPRPARPGFAGGGKLTQATARRAVEDTGATSGGGGGAIAAIVAPNNQSLDRMLRNGRSAFYSFIEDEAPGINAVLNRNKRN